MDSHDGNSCSRLSGNCAHSCAPGCFEPAQEETTPNWSYVGEGRGDYKELHDFSYVGEGEGGYKLDDVTTYRGCRPRPWLFAAVAFLAATGAVIAYAWWQSLQDQATMASTTPAPSLRGNW